MPDAFSEERLDEAIERLSRPGALHDAESLVASAAPKLQRILGQALQAGGWFAESHEDEVARAASVADDAERMVAVRTLLAEEARIGMLVGVAVGWALHRELQHSEA